jgi:hypothetical protein
LEYAKNKFWDKLDLDNFYKYTPANQK